MNNLNSLYENLYDVEFDYELNYLIEKLYMKSKEMFFQSYRTKVESMSLNHDKMSERLSLFGNDFSLESNTLVALNSNLTMNSKSIITTEQNDRIQQS